VGTPAFVPFFRWRCYVCGTCWELVGSVWDFFITQVWKWFKKRCKGNWFVRRACKVLKFIAALISTIVGFVISVVLGIVCAIVCAFCFVLWFIVCVLDTVFDQQKCPDATAFCMEGVQVGGSGGAGSSGVVPPSGTTGGGGVAGGGLAGRSTGWGSRRSVSEGLAATKGSLIVTDVSQLRALSVWHALIQPRRSPIILQLTGMSSELLRYWETRINRYLSSCGCEEGALSLLIGCGAYVVYLIVVPPSSANGIPNWPTWPVVTNGIVIACVAAGIGKAIGLLRAQLLLVRARRHLTAALQ
jgi:hypothetical protein